MIMTFILFASCGSNKSWRDASRESVGIAPKASELKEDIVQIYFARAFSWRGYFGVHPWIAYKKVEDEEYTVAQVTAWNLRREGTTVSVKKDLPDRRWFDSYPTLHDEIRGKKAREIIDQIEKLLTTYPHKDLYRVWPGPNSNTFVAYMMRNIDGLDKELPASAVGKDYLDDNVFMPTASGTGFQFSVFGLLGLSLGLQEGIEINLLGLNFGLDIWTPALKIPFAGRVGFPDR